MTTNVETLTNNVLTQLKDSLFHGPITSYDRTAVLAYLINIKLLNKCPDLFNQGLVMTAPTDIVDGRVVMAKARALKTQLTLELMQDVKHSIEAFDLAVDEAVIGIIAELMSESIRIASTENSKIVYYVPVRAMLAVNEKTFQPIVQFVTRYAVHSEGQLFNDTHQD